MIVIILIIYNRNNEFNIKYTIIFQTIVVINEEKIQMIKEIEKIVFL